MSQVTITPSQIQFETQADETILEAALRQGYNLPNACQSGMCGTCIAQVVSGEVALGDYDDCALTDEDAAAGMVLLCACQPKGDVVLDLPAYEGASDCAAYHARAGGARGYSRQHGSAAAGVAQIAAV